PLESVLVRAASSIPCDRFSRMTSSPPAGFPLVPFVTVPVSVSAAAPIDIRMENESGSIFKACRNGVCLFSGFVCWVWVDRAGLDPRPSWLSRSTIYRTRRSAFQTCDLSQDRRSLLFQRSLHGLEVALGKLSCLVFKIEIAQVFIHSFFPL